MAIRIEGQANTMAAVVSEIAAFPDNTFVLGYPEAIGDAAAAQWFGGIHPTWEKQADGSWLSKGAKEGELSYEMVVMPREDVVETRFRLKNESSRAWANGLAFNCFQCGASPAIRDHECVRHWVCANGQLKRLIEIPRKFGPRPAIQLYGVEGAPRPADIPFVANFNSTPDITLEGWMAIQAKDSKRLVATVSKPALFLFQNMEYSCIHSGAGFGPLKPGEVAEAINLTYFVESTLNAWYDRMKKDLEKAQLAAGPPCEMINLKI